MRKMVGEAACTMEETKLSSASTEDAAHRYELSSSKSEDHWGFHSLCDARLSAPMSPLKKWDHDLLAEGQNKLERARGSSDYGWFSPSKASREKGSLKLDEKVAKRSPTSVFELEAQEASNVSGLGLDRKLSGFERSLLQPFPGFGQSQALNESGELLFELKEQEESTLEAQALRRQSDGGPVPNRHERSSSIFSHFSDLTISTVEKDLVPRSPTRQLSKELEDNSPGFRKSFTSTTCKSADDSIPQKPKRQDSLKAGRRASHGSVPREITCVPHDASPTKPYRQDSNDIRKALFSLQEALARTQMAVEDSQERPHHHQPPKLSKPRFRRSQTRSTDDSLPMKPRRKRSMGSSADL